MRDVSAFRTEMRKLGIRVEVRTDAQGRRRLGLKGPSRVMTAAILAEARALEAELLAAPGAKSGPARSPVGEGSVPRPGPVRPDPTDRRAEPPPTADRTDLGPPPADRSWRRIVGLWPIDWRRRWGHRANEREDQGEPWDVAEWRAFHEVARDLAAADDRGEVPVWSYPDPSARGDLTDAEAVAAIDWAFTPPPRWRGFSRQTP